MTAAKQPAPTANVTRKRQLAEELISGRESAGSLHVAELVELMNEVG